MGWLRLSFDPRSIHRNILLELFPVDVEPLQQHGQWRGRGWSRAIEDRWLDQNSEPVAWLDTATGNAVLIEAIGAEELEGVVQARLWVQAAGRLVDLIPGGVRRYTDHASSIEWHPSRTAAICSVLDEVTSIEALGLPQPVPRSTTGEIGA